MTATITPAPLSGCIAAIPSKSDAHRVLIGAALGDRPISFPLPAASADIEATIACLNALGATITLTDGVCHVIPITTPTPQPILDCGESGSTLRFLMPVAAALGCDATFVGHGRLPARPIDDLLNTLAAHGVTASATSLPLKLRGHLLGGEYIIPGNISSQYITGLLFALPLLREQASIRLTNPLESSGYVTMTCRTMARFGVGVGVSGGTFTIKAGTHYQTPDALDVEGDWSNSAFWLAAGALGRPVTLTGLSSTSAQGDRAILPLLRRFGATVTESNGQITVSPSKLTGIPVDMRDIPDLLPPLAVVAAAAHGTTRLYNAARCRLKECDRLSGMAALLKSLGAHVEEHEEELIIHGTGHLRGGIVDSRNDHRLVMASALSAILCATPVTISGSDAVAKSYPLFFAHYQQLGGRVK